MADDAKLGVKSTALLFGSYIRTTISLFAVAFVVLLAIAGNLNGQGLPFYLVSVGGAALHIGWQAITFNPANPTDCRNKFLVRGHHIPIHSKTYFLQSRIQNWD